METINEYVVNVDENENENEEEIPKTTKAKKQKKKTKKELGNENDNDDDETFKKRVILISKKEEINFSSNEIKSLNKNKIDTLYEIYEENKIQTSFSDNCLQPFIEMFVKSLSYILVFDDEDELKKDLMENNQLKKLIGRFSLKLGINNYDEKMSFLNIIFIISKHIKSTRFKEEKEEEDA